MLIEISSAIVIGLILLLHHLTRKPRPLWKPDDENASTSDSRHLGTFETLMARMTETCDFNLSNVIFVQSKHLLTKEIVHKALTALSQRHPLLQMRLGKENGQFTFMEKIKDFKVDLEVCQTEDWQGVMEDVLLKIYDGEIGPLWYVKFLPHASFTNVNDRNQDAYPHQAAFVFAFHHVIVDGSSYLRLFAEFVDTLHEILNDQQPEVVTSLPLLPPLEAYIDNAKIYSPSYNLKTNLINISGVLTSVPSLLKFLAKSFMKPALFLRNLGVETDKNPNTPKRTCIIPVELSKKDTKQLLALCKIHKTTVQSAIQAAACVAYWKMAVGGRDTRTRNIECRVTCNLRRYLDTNKLNDHLGTYMSLLTMDTEVGPKPAFWEIVAKISRNLPAKLKACEPFLVTSLIANISGSAFNILHDVTASLPGGRDSDLTFNNYGNFNSVLNRDGSSSVQLAGYFGCTGELTQGSVFSHNLVTFNNKLSWTVTYYAHVTSKRLAMQYADLTIQTLLEELKVEI